MDLFVTGNYVEAALWITIGAAFVVCMLRRGARRYACGLAAVAFIAFGLSDVVEVGTGAWWTPWWLLAWKATCVLAMAGLLADDLRRSRARRIVKG